MKILVPRCQESLQGTLWSANSLTRLVRSYQGGFRALRASTDSRYPTTACCIYTITCPDKSLEAAEEFQTPRHPWMPSTPPTEAHHTSQVVRKLTSFFLKSVFFSSDVEYGATSGTATPTGSDSAANQVQDSFLQTRKKRFVWKGCE